MENYNNLQKSRKGIVRIWHALGYSFDGLRAAFGEAAFRQEAIAAFFLVPAAFFLGQDWAQVALLAGSALLLLVVELLNTAIEAVVDLVSPQWHELSKRAKDMGSAAVLITLIFTICIWVAALYDFFR